MLVIGPTKEDPPDDDNDALPQDLRRAISESIDTPSEVVRTESAIEDCLEKARARGEYQKRLSYYRQTYDLSAAANRRKRRLKTALTVIRETVGLIFMIMPTVVTMHWL